MDKDLLTKSNYYLCSRVTFKGCKKPKRKPDYVSASGSTYWYGSDKHGDYVIRESDHWSNLWKKEYPEDRLDNFGCGRVANCYWSLKTSKNTIGFGEYICGKAYFKNFKANVH